MAPAPLRQPAGDRDGAGHADHAVHEHVWHLTAVEFEDLQQVSSFECEGCPAVRMA